MDENVRFQSDAHYALPQYKEFCALNIYAHFRNSFLHLLATVCILFLIYMLRLNISPVTLLLLNLFCLGLHLLRRFRDRDGGIAYKRMLRSNNGMAPRVMLSLRDFGVKTLNADSGQEIATPFASLRYLLESKNLLVLVDEVKLCHIIDKRNLTGGSRDDLVAYLRSNCPKLKKRIRTPLFGRIVFCIFIAVNILALLISLAFLLRIPEKLSGKLHNSMSYQQMARELEAADIHITDRTILELEEYDAQYADKYGDYYKENPGASKVLDLLYWEGSGIYDQETGIWTPSSSGVYWFDMEVFDVSRMYTHLLTGVDALDDDLSFTSITEDYGSVDFETGAGTVRVSFDYCGTTYHINAAFDHDWYDPLVLSQIGRILDLDTPPEKLWYAYDGQALFLYYGTAEQQKILEAKTGIPWLDLAKVPLYSN